MEKLVPHVGLRNNTSKERNVVCDDNYETNG